MRLGELVVTEAPNGKWCLVQPLTLYHSVTYDKVRVPLLITVPIGFPTDLASIPRILTWAFPVNAKHRRAAVVHDFMCENSELPQKIIDDVFYDMMIFLDVSPWKARAMHWGVRGFSIAKGK